MFGKPIVKQVTIMIAACILVSATGPSPASASPSASPAAVDGTEVHPFDVLATDEYNQMMESEAYRAQFLAKKVSKTAFPPGPSQAFDIIASIPRPVLAAMLADAANTTSSSTMSKENPSHPTNNGMPGSCDNIPLNEPRMFRTSLGDEACSMAGFVWLILTAVDSVAGAATNPATPVADRDTDGDGMGDSWEALWQSANYVLEAAQDSEPLDGLSNLDEFRWEMIPVCLPSGFPDNPATPLINEAGLNLDACRDFDQDKWEDGDEVHYWNNPENDAMTDHLKGTGFTATDPDINMDVDNDTIRNTHDTDSDNDGLLDGDEYNTYESYPEFRDSDCAVASTSCTLPRQTSYWDEARVGQPGTGDGIPDNQELEQWKTIGPDAWSKNFDRDSIESNLLDPDSDNDGLLDGEEMLIWRTHPHVVDTDLDGLTDYEEIRRYGTNATRWDTDGDGMPDKWEVDNHLNPRVNDASVDGDRDGLISLHEYQYNRPSDWREDTDGPWPNGTNPLNPDTEGDGLFDGPEVKTHRTNPFYWDTDDDRMPDAWEVTHGLDPNSDDGSGDKDNDAFDEPISGGHRDWTNLEEYEFGRPPAWNEVNQGPWPGGTDPTDIDTDDDQGRDGYEVYYGYNPTIPMDPAEDTDKDGLAWELEGQLATNPNTPDSDGDGICDGGQDDRCFRPGSSGNGHYGERDYGSNPWVEDSDGDGLLDRVEVLLWDPNATGEALDVDGDMLNGIIDFDSDNDGLGDGFEYNGPSDPGLADTDADGLNDYDEVVVWLTEPREADTDGDGLLDGMEANELHTDPHDDDTDGDGLSDGDEVLLHGTDPTLIDTDQDGMDDLWEVSERTVATKKDHGADPDNDGLTNLVEYNIRSTPLAPDSDGDGMPDGWEYHNGFIATLPGDAAGDADNDGAKNLQEYLAQTDPWDGDTDDDDLWDGPELNLGTDPLAKDTDADGLDDGDEVLHDLSSDPLVQDTDGDQLDDRGERDANTDPRLTDTDGDDLTDYEEVVEYAGKYQPVDPDTNDDGFTDWENSRLEGCPDCDDDLDGLSNRQEEDDFKTNPFIADTDCDGIEDGPEEGFWQERYGLETVKAYLVNPDSDNDGIVDGIEIGSIGTPSRVLHRSQPDDADSDDDGILDGSEAHNNFKKENCERVRPAMGMTPWAPTGLFEPGTKANPVKARPWPLPTPLDGAPIATVATSPPLLAALAPGDLYRDADDLVYGVDEQGLFLQGGYGVRLHLDLEGIPLDVVRVDPEDVLLQRQARGPDSGVPCTVIDFRDTDEDGLLDGEEQRGTHNTYKNDVYSANHDPGNTDPCDDDTDDDGLVDGIEVGRKINRQPLLGAWRTNPNNMDTDGDTLRDGEEAPSGVKDLLFNSQTGVYSRPGGSTVGSNPVDADTDDDGLPDGLIRAPSGAPVSPVDDDPLNWDMDFDGLSDGLERAVSHKVITEDGVLHTHPRENLFGLTDWDTYQPYKGPAIDVSSLGNRHLKADMDGDGLLDGLEDLNHDGIWGALQNETDPGNPDTDGDRLGDGRELLVTIRSSAEGPTKTFASLFLEHGFTLDQLSWDPGNPWETDPRIADTDGDGVIDGLDINPRRESNFVSVGFAGFEFLDRLVDVYPFTGIEMYARDLWVAMPFGGMEYRLRMHADDHVVVPTRNYAGWGTRLPYGPLPDNLIGAMEAADREAEPDDYLFGATYGKDLWRVKQLDNHHILKFQLPEDIEKVKPQNMKIEMGITLKDADIKKHDTLDLYPDQEGELKEGLAEIDLSVGTVGVYNNDYGNEYFGAKEVQKTMVGTGTKSPSSNDAKLGLELGHTLDQHFINAWDVTKHIGTAHLGDVANGGSGGRDYLGTTQEFPV